MNKEVEKMNTQLDQSKARMTGENIYFSECRAKLKYMSLPVYVVCLV